MERLCRVKLMAGHINDKNGEESPLIAHDVRDIIVQVRCLLRVWTGSQATGGA